MTWTGKLLDENFDQFGIHMKLPNKPNETLYFPTVQECESGVHRWIEIPAAGKVARRLQGAGAVPAAHAEAGQPLSGVA